MKKPFQTFLMIAGAAACIGAAPFAMSQFGGESAPGKSLTQTILDWRDGARNARRQREAEERARRERKEAQEAADLEATANYRMKFSGCQRQAAGQGLHFLNRMRFVGECMHNS